jgi:2'-5' RNA ligase
MPRLFTAIELPSELRGELYRLHQPLPGARWIHRDNYHVTLRFVGDIPRHEAREFADNLASIEVDPFELRITGLGVFGGNDPHAVWAAVDMSPALEELARAHEKAARNAGFPPEKRPFKPHVTLARLKHSNPQAIARFLTRYGGYRSQPIYVTRTVLMSSRPVTGGGPYAIEDIFPMRGGDFTFEDRDSVW